MDQQTILLGTVIFGALALGVAYIAREGFKAGKVKTRCSGCNREFWSDQSWSRCKSCSIKDRIEHEALEAESQARFDAVKASVEPAIRQWLGAAPAVPSQTDFEVSLRIPRGLLVDELPLEVAAGSLSSAVARCLTETGCVRRLSSPNDPLKYGAAVRTWALGWRDGAVASYDDRIWTAFHDDYSGQSGWRVERTWVRTVPSGAILFVRSMGTSWNTP
jgi:hypothetical protein